MTEYKFILELARHGARAPSVLFDFTAEGQANFPEAMALTQLGVDQHYALGEYVRGKYFANDAQIQTKTMKQAEVYAQSTNVNRTKQSTTSQLQGLFGKGTTWPALDPINYPVIADVNGNKLVVIDTDNCERFQEIQDDVTSSQEWKSLYETKMGSERLQPYVYDWLTEETGEDGGLLHMSDVATYVHIARYHDMQLKFEVTEEHFHWCRAASDQFTYDWFGATPETWQLANREQLKLLSELVDVIFDSATPASDSILSTNLYANGSLYSPGEMPYLWILLGHQETLWPLSVAMGIEVAAKMPFASSYFFEFLTKDGQDYVNLVHRDDEGNTNDVKLDCSVSDAETACEKAEFKSFINKKVTKAYEIDCDTAYPDTDHKYNDIDIYLADLLTDLDLAKYIDLNELNDHANSMKTVQSAMANLIQTSASLF